MSCTKPGPREFVPQVHTHKSFIGVRLHLSDVLIGGERLIEPRGGIVPAFCQGVVTHTRGCYIRRELTVFQGERLKRHSQLGAGVLRKHTPHLHAGMAQRRHPHLHRKTTRGVPLVGAVRSVSGQQRDLLRTQAQLLASHFEQGRRNALPQLDFATANLKTAVVQQANPLAQQRRGLNAGG